MNTPNTSIDIFWCGGPSILDKIEKLRFLKSSIIVPLFSSLNTTIEILYATLSNTIIAYQSTIMDNTISSLFFPFFSLSHVTLYIAHTGPPIGPVANQRKTTKENELTIPFNYTV